MYNILKEKYFLSCIDNLLCYDAFFLNLFKYNQRILIALNYQYI